MTKTMNFLEAVESAKQGNLIAREEEWGDKVVFIRPLFETEAETVINEIKSVPDDLKRLLENWETTPETITFTAYLSAYNGLGIIENGWQPSNKDIYAEDWYIVEI